MGMESWDRTVEVDLLKAVKWMNNETGKRVAKEIRKSKDFKNLTGTLRKSVRVKQSKFDKVSCFVKVGAPHAHLVEYGHDTYKGREYEDEMIVKAGRNFGKTVRKLKNPGVKSGRVEGRHFVEKTVNRLEAALEDAMIKDFVLKAGVEIA